MSARSSSSRAWCAGEVGLLAEEGCQRLCSIFSEEALSSLRQLLDMSQRHGEARVPRLFRVGLDSIADWGRDVVHEEVARLLTRYPEARTLHSFAYFRVLDLLDEDFSSLAEPELHDVYHRFLRRVAEHPDVRRGRGFLEQAYGLQRAVFVEAFRNAYHDALRQMQAAARMRRRPEKGRAEEERVVEAGRVDQEERVVDRDERVVERPETRATDERADARGAELRATRTAEREAGEGDPPTEDVATSLKSAKSA